MLTTEYAKQAQACYERTGFADYDSYEAAACAAREAAEKAAEEPAESKIAIIVSSAKEGAK